jgi:hypothetical protein
MRKRVALLIATALLGAAPLATAGDANARKRYWEERLARELPSGSDLSTVQRFFENAHLEHSYDERSKTVYAVERNVSGWLVRWDVMIKSRIGAADTLQGCTAQAVGTGP